MYKSYALLEFPPGRHIKRTLVLAKQEMIFIIKKKLFTLLRKNLKDPFFL